jgi:predicted RNase H-like HicB family nuclease
MSTVLDLLTIHVETFTGHEEGEDDVGHPYYVASCDVIGLVADGETFEELLANLQEALAASLEDRDTLRDYGVSPDARIVLQMEIPAHYAKTA